MSEHLFLLIGKNPLPNYVAAKLFLEQETKIHFIYTVGANGTEEYKNRIVAKLRSQYQANYFEVFDVPLVGASGASHIESAIENHFNAESSGTKIIQPGDSIHLNYTGGTKAMSVHVYRTIEKCAKNNQLAFSYLNPRTLKMEFDDGRDSLNLSDVNLPNFAKTKLKLREIIELHGLVFQQRGDGREIYPSDKAKFSELLTVLSAFRNDEIKWSAYQTFRNANFSYLNYPKQHTEIEIPNELNELVAPLNSIGQRQFGKDLVENNVLKFGNLPDEGRRKSFGMFLLSKWLESFVVQKIIKANDKNIEDFGMNLCIAKKSTPNQSFMEIDAFAVRGYQLFAISCSVAKDKDERLDKLFEIAHRAKQLGGDEARIGLVCFADGNQLDLLRNQFKEDNIRVFGKNDLGTLEVELQKWFDNK